MLSCSDKHPALDPCLLQQPLLLEKFTCPYGEKQLLLSWRYIFHPMGRRDHQGTRGDTSLLCGSVCRILMWIIKPGKMDATRCTRYNKFCIMKPYTFLKTQTKKINNFAPTPQPLTLNMAYSDCCWYCLHVQSLASDRNMNFSVRDEGVTSIIQEAPKGPWSSALPL